MHMLYDDNGIRCFLFYFQLEPTPSFSNFNYCCHFFSLHPAAATNPLFAIVTNQSHSHLNNNKTMMNNNTNQSESSSLYDKLNNVHASLRKQKEDAFRTKQLAEQRLNIQRQDRETMERKAAETRSNLHSLKENATEMKNGNITLEVQSKGLEKEVRCLISLISLK